MNSSSKALVLIDDEKAYIDLIAHMLAEHLGCRVLTYTHPADALAALPSVNAGCVVTDFHMPDINGFEVIRRGSRLLPGVPFLLISGHAVHLAEDQLDWPPAMRALIAKPFGWRTLADQLAQHAPEFLASLPKAEARPTPA